jgi:Sigma-70, region 4
MRITELDLSLPALVCCQRLGLTAVDQLLTYTASELVGNGFGPHELYDVLCRLNDHGRVLPTSPQSLRTTQRQSGERNRIILRLRVLDGMTFGEIAERVDIGPERVRQILRWHFGVIGTMPTFRARKWADKLASNN